MKDSMKGRMAEAERRIEEARRTRAEALDLVDLVLPEIPASLGALTDLRELKLGRRQLSDSLPEWPQLTDLSPLAELKGLRALSLSCCRKAWDLQPLAGLQMLQKLDLSYTQVRDLEPLAELQALQKLSLAYTTKVTNIGPLAGLPALQHLSLVRTKVRDLGPLARLQTLQSLSLSLTNVTDLRPLAGLQALQTLRMAFTKATDLGLLTGLQALQTLMLFQTSRDLTPDLLRAFSKHPGLVKLIADRARGVPPEVLSREANDNCLPRLRAYFAEIDSGAEPDNEVKIILLGNGQVGKTQLCRKLRGEEYNESVESTHGVQLWRQELHLKVEGEEETFQVNWWDFGGQDIYHGTHALFLKSRAVFLILWTRELENRDEYFDGEIPLRNQPLTYWLEYVRSLAGEESPVIVVQSRCDGHEDRATDPARPEEATFFECCAYSAKTERGRETLETHLREAVRYLLERSGRYGIGHGRAEIRRRLYEWRNEDQERAPEERRHRTLTTARFQELCNEVGNIVSWEHALDYLHQTGVVFYDPELFEDQIILDQDWALDAIYTVFHRGRTAPLLQERGRFTREDLALLAWPEHSVEEQHLFLGLMESCGVCFPCGETARGQKWYVAPDLLPPFETVEPRLHAWRTADPETPTLRLEYRFFHPAIIRDLMSEIGRKAGEAADYWKYGLWFMDGERDTQLVVHFEDTSTDEAPGAGALTLQAQGKDPLGLLREIRHEIWWRSRWRASGYPPEELLTLDGTTVSQKAFDNAIDGRTRATDGRIVDIAPFAAFFTGALREHEDREIAISPRRLTEDEKPREVFISYAWGDDSPEGRILGQVVDRLQEALDSDGFLPVRDRDRMQTGDLISTFINRLTRADRVVAVVSDKYLRSSFCMYEIYRLWQRAQGDPEELARRVVPIVLPDVKIGSFRERAPYLEHWSREAKDLEALIRNPNLSPSRESWQEVRLVREFAHHVDDILVFLNDVLMPRQLDVHLDDVFEAVRDALRRRLKEEA